MAFTNVTFRRGACVVLDDVTFAIAPGEFVGIIGGNGAGKSTLLHLALGLLAPSEGTVRIFAGDPRRKHRPLGYVPQRIELARDVPLRARDFVALGVDGERFGLPLPNRARAQRVEVALRDVGALALADKPVGRLSGGEQQRLAIAQAVVGEPALLLLDEPLANLDLGSAVDVVTLVRRIAQERGMTVLLVAHDVNPLMRAIDRVLYLANGRAALGTVDHIINEDVLSRLYDRPVDVVRVRGRIIVVAGT
ncbi:MAG: ATP-binding cassette domain-containing protein [Candidatus Eremiobacteraeota bacterium]|nr:ATP-binding cassette domain-containing protein [Candidatus Eremiobacteraeota bacterium]MBC5802658.1 ATP-binding cassette domain-containing protein [Candidatus Eremiobacteraeota bacterium]MBC5822041.1 ATP-binding cassette domain-containing protein [Candidatus Eremiobacteraeota bacterium]